MRKFNFKEAKAGAKLCTRDGKDARIICYNRKSSYPIVALLTTTNRDGETEEVETYTKAGYYWKREKGEKRHAYRNDLFIK